MPFSCVSSYLTNRAFPTNLKLNITHASQRLSVQSYDHVKMQRNCRSLPKETQAARHFIRSTIGLVFKRYFDPARIAVKLSMLGAEDSQDIDPNQQTKVRLRSDKMKVRMIHQDHVPASQNSVTCEKRRPGSRPLLRLSAPSLTAQYSPQNRKITVSHHTSTSIKEDLPELGPRLNGSAMNTFINGAQEPPILSLGETHYATSRQKLNRINNTLRDLGAEHVGVELPRIVVIGNQSAGKSSLLEAISQIELPRAGAQACTKCPMELILSTSAEGSLQNWQGTVSLRWLTEIPRGRTQRLERFGSAKRREDVPALLRRAQLAVLNPTIDPATFAQMSDEQCRDYSSRSSLRFTRNVVVLDVIGADVDVTLVDLPGMFIDVGIVEKCANCRIQTRILSPWSTTSQQNTPARMIASSFSLSL
jgi:hypothetical protein